MTKAQIFIYYPDSPDCPLFGNGRLSWRGEVVEGTFTLFKDSILAKLIPKGRYMVYRAKKRPHWRFSSSKHGDLVDENEILIYRPWGYLDEYCSGLKNLIARVHRQLGLDYSTISPRYRLPMIVEENDEQKTPTEEGHSDGESTDSVYETDTSDTDECLYFMVNPLESESDGGSTGQSDGEH